MAITQAAGEIRARMAESNVEDDAKDAKARLDHLAAFKAKMMEEIQDKPFQPLRNKIRTLINYIASLSKEEQIIHFNDIQSTYHHLLPEAVAQSKQSAKTNELFSKLTAEINALDAERNNTLLSQQEAEKKLKEKLGNFIQSILLHCEMHKADAQGFKKLVPEAAIDAKTARAILIDPEKILIRANLEKILATIKKCTGKPLRITSDCTYNKALQENYKLAEELNSANCLISAQGLRELETLSESKENAVFIVTLNSAQVFNLILHASLYLHRVNKERLSYDPDDCQEELRNQFNKFSSRLTLISAESLARYQIKEFETGPHGHLGELLFKQLFVHEFCNRYPNTRMIAMDAKPWLYTKLPEGFFARPAKVIAAKGHQSTEGNPLEMLKLALRQKENVLVTMPLRQAKCQQNPGGYTAGTHDEKIQDEKGQQSRPHHDENLNKAADGAQSKGKQRIK